MRGLRISLMVLGMGLAGTPAQAGLYNTAEKPLPITSLSKARQWLGELRGARIRKEDRDKPALAGSKRAEYLSLVARLESQERAGTLLTEDRANLGACYIRLGWYTDAIRVLQAGDPEHFMIQANLANAYHQLGDLFLAIRHQERAMARLAQPIAGWTAAQRFAFRRTETYYLNLLKDRSREQREGKAATQVDALFPGLRFVGPDGTYTAGEWSMDVALRLPPNAMDIVLQFVVWMPHDDRLFWQFGEFLNALGEVKEAYEVLNELSFTRTGSAFPDLLKHRKVLAQALEVSKAFPPAEQGPVVQVHLLALLSPRGLIVSPGAGNIAQETAALSPVVLLPLLRPRRGELPIPPTPPDAATAEPARLPNWKHIIVSFVFGFLAAALLGLQWQEWRRRRQPAGEEVDFESAEQSPLPAEAQPRSGVASPAGEEGPGLLGEHSEGEKDHQAVPGAPTAVTTRPER
jgi:tetratricopeptide (TPR) repeat protein